MISLKILMVESGCPWGEQGTFQKWYSISSAVNDTLIISRISFDKDLEPFLIGVVPWAPAGKI